MFTTYYFKHSIYYLDYISRAIAHELKTFSYRTNNIVHNALKKLKISIQPRHILQIVITQ